MHNRTWTLKLTPTGGPAETISGLSDAEAAVVTQNLIARVPTDDIAFSGDRAAASHDTALAA